MVLKAFLGRLLLCVPLKKNISRQAVYIIEINVTLLQWCLYPLLMHSISAYNVLLKGKDIMKYRHHFSLDGPVIVNWLVISRCSTWSDFSIECETCNPVSYPELLCTFFDTSRNKHKHCYNWVVRVVIVTYRTYRLLLFSVWIHHCFI